MDKIILHIDMNSYFASVEQQANPFLRGKPIAITGKHQERSVVTTASIEAKKLGVKTAMSTWEAKRICPSIIFYPGDPKKYSDITDRFNTIYESFSSRVEQFSVDESFLDITLEAKDYLGATYIAQMIRARLKEELGEHITASIGIAPNKLMAKLASEQVKPNGLTVVRPQDVVDLLDNADLRDLCGIGPAIYARLEAAGIQTFSQLRETPKSWLIEQFHRYGAWLYDAARGHDSSVIQSPTTSVLKGTPETQKSYGHAYTLPQNTQNSHIIRRYLLGLADKVSWRLRRDKKTACRVHTYIRYEDFTSFEKQQRYHEPINDGLTLFKIAWNTISLNLDKPVRLVGISVSALSTNQKTMSLFKKDESMRNVLSALDMLQHRYGRGIWHRGSTLHTPFKERSSGFHFDHTL